jgi:peptidoglycan/xylan/chitin deacetylase (PgdA/CDA1 family)
MRTTLSGLAKYQAILYRLFFLFRLTEVAKHCNRTKTMILCYHGITRRIGPDPEDRSAIAVDRSLFLSQLKYLKSHYNVIALRDYLVARQSGKHLPRHSVILTFDDGLRNFLTVTAPILRRLDLPATMFLVTDQVDMRDRAIQGSDWTPLDDRICLSWAEAKALHSDQDIEFGSHTCSHPELPQLSASVEREFRDSFRAIRENLQDSFPPSLAYPYGDYTEFIAERARSMGYSCALTTEPGSNSMKTGLFQLRRAVVRRYDTTEIFAARVSGLIGWLRILKDVLQSLSLPLVRVWDATFSQCSSD